MIERNAFKIVLVLLGAYLGVLAQQLTALNALAEDSGSVSSTCTMAPKHPK